MDALLEVEGLRASFRTREGEIRAVDGVSFGVGRGETVALVGESGCGKSVTARSVMGLYSGSRASVSGSIRFKGEELSEAAPARRAALRGASMAMIFQEPMSAFDPLATIGEQMVDARLAHHPGGRGARAEALELAVESLRAVGIPDPAIRARDYPHRLSGGMLQRALIATALMNEPELLVADEPTTALDVTIQAQVLRLMRDLRQKRGMGLLFITHDLGVVAEIADRVQVMYAGRIVESATVAEFFAADSGPLHPYGKGLLASRVKRGLKGAALPSIPGTVPRPTELPGGCRFAPRCASALPRCAREEPVLARVEGSTREAACWLLAGGVE